MKHFCSYIRTFEIPYFTEKNYISLISLHHNVNEVITNNLSFYLLVRIIAGVCVLGDLLVDLPLRSRSRLKVSTSLCVSVTSFAAVATPTFFSTSSRDR